jgi:hypothetical protein
LFIGSPAALEDGRSTELLGFFMNLIEQACGQGESDELGEFHADLAPRKWTKALATSLQNFAARNVRQRSYPRAIEIGTARF